MFPCWDEPAFRATFQLTRHGAGGVGHGSQHAGGEAYGARRARHHHLRALAEDAVLPDRVHRRRAGAVRSRAAAGTDSASGRCAARSTTAQTALANAQADSAGLQRLLRLPLSRCRSSTRSPCPAAFPARWKTGARSPTTTSCCCPPASTMRQRQTVFQRPGARDGAPVERRPGDHGLVGRHLAQRELRLLDGRQGNRPAQPDWKWWEAQDADKEGAMRADARATSHPIQQHVTDELQAANAFDPRSPTARARRFCACSRRISARTRFATASAAT